MTAIDRLLDLADRLDYEARGLPEDSTLGYEVTAIAAVLRSRLQQAELKGVA